MDIWAATSYKPQISQILHISLKNDTFFENSSGKMFLSMQFKAYIRRSVFLNSLFKEGGKDMKRIVVIICITIALLAAAVGTGYRYGAKYGYRDSYINAQEMKAYEIGKEYGIWIGRQRPFLEIITAIPRPSRRILPFQLSKRVEPFQQAGRKMSPAEEEAKAVELWRSERFKLSPKPEPGPFQ